MKLKLLSSVLVGFFGLLTACNAFASLPTGTPLPATAQANSPDPARQPTNEQALTRAPSPTEGIFPAGTFAFSQPEGGQVGGISGVFTHENVPQPDATCTKDYDLLRFYDDGLVLYASLCLSTDFLESWPKINQWFHRDSDTQMSRGEYHVQDEHIWFSTTVIRPDNKEVVVDYSGTYLGSKLILDSYSHFTGHKRSGTEYVQVSVEP